MGAKAKKQKRGPHEAALADVGKRKIDASRAFDPAEKKVLELARRDNTDLYRGRANADAAQAFKNGVGHREAAQSGRIGSLAETQGLRTGATMKALSEGTKRGVLEKDATTNDAIGLSLGTMAQSGNIQKRLATEEFKNLEQKARLAQEKTNNMRGAAVGVASLGAQQYMDYKNSQIDTQNLKNFEKWKAVPGNENKGLDVFMREEGGNGFQYRWGDRNMFQAATDTNPFASVAPYLGGGG